MRDGRRRAARVALGLAAGVALAAALAAGGGLLWLRTPAGARFVGGRVLAAANATLAGTLEAGAFRARGLALEADGLVLRAPGGEPVAGAARLSGVPLLPLVRGRLELDGAVATGPWVRLASGPGGPPLLAALRRRPAAGAGGAAGVELRAVEVRDGWAELPGGGAVTGVAGALRGGPRWTVRLEGAVRGPVAGRLRIEAGPGPDGALAASARLDGPGGRLAATAAIDPAARSLRRLEARGDAIDLSGLPGGGPRSRLAVRLQAVGALGPAGPAGILSARVTGAVGGRPVRAALAAGLAGAAATAQVAVALPEGGLTAEARRSADGLALDARAPRLAFGGAALRAVRLSARRRAGTGEASLRLDAARLATAGFGSYDRLALGARARGGRLVIDVLSADGARGRLRGAGEVRRDGDGVALRLGARLAAFPIVGQGRLRARVDGAIAIRGRLSRAGLRAAVELDPEDVRLPARPPGALEPARPADGVRIVARDAPIADWRSSGEAPARTPEPADAPGPLPPATVDLTVARARPAPIRGSALDVEAALVPGFRVVYAGRWRFFGTLRVPRGRVVILGTAVPVLPRSQLRFFGPVGRPLLVLGVRPGFEPRSVLVIHGEPSDLDLGLSPPGATPDQVFDALEASLARQGGSPLQARLPLVGVRLPLAQLLRGSAASSYQAGAPVTGRIRMSTSGRIGADAPRGESEHTAQIELGVGGIGSSMRGQASAGDAGNASAGLRWTKER